MNKKNFWLLLAAVAAVVLLGGVKGKMPEQSEEQTEENFVPREETKGYEVPGTDIVLSYRQTEDGIQIDGCSQGTEGELVIPETIDGKSVTCISNWAFYDCHNLTGIKLPSTVTKIGYNAFAGCRALTEMDLPDEIMDISEGAFYGCSGLENVFIESENELYCTIDGVLFDKLGMKLLKYPQGKKETVYKIPEEVRTIDDDAFSYCSNLTDVKLPMKLKKIGEASFACCSSLTALDFPISLTDIGIGAFSYCSSLTSIRLPKNVTTLGSSAFSDCSSLKTVIMPENLTTIREWTFVRCSSLEKITLPKKLTGIGSSVFYDCKKLADVYYTGSAEDWENISIDSIDDEKLLNAVIHYNSPLPSENDELDFPVVNETVFGV